MIAADVLPNKVATCAAERHGQVGATWAEAQAVSAEMARGSCQIYTGQTWHGAGHNSTTAPRLALNFAYQSACLNQEENMYTAYPPAVARRFPEHLRRLVGYFSDF